MLEWCQILFHSSHRIFTLISPYIHSLLTVTHSVNRCPLSVLCCIYKSSHCVLYIYRVYTVCAVCVAVYKDSMYKKDLLVLFDTCISKSFFDSIESIFYPHVLETPVHSIVNSTVDRFSSITFLREPTFTSAKPFMNSASSFSALTK